MNEHLNSFPPLCDTMLQICIWKSLNVQDKLIYYIVPTYNKMYIRDNKNVVLNMRTLQKLD